MATLVTFSKLISSVVVAVMIMLCFAIQEAHSASAGGCSNTGGCFDGNTPASQLLRYFHHRKVLLAKNGLKEMASRGGDGATTMASAGNVGDWELRRVPSGPDPLHHNGDSPKKPRTTP